MTGEATSLSVLAAVANEQRAAIRLQAVLPLMQGTRPLSQIALPLGRGALPLLARQLLLPPNTIPQRTLLAGSRPMFRVAPRPTHTVKHAFAVVSKPAISKPAIPAVAAVGKPAVQATVKPTAPAKPTPKKYLQDIFVELDIGESKLPKRYNRGDFVKPDEEECKSYNEAASLVRTNDLEKLRALHEEGKNLDACNRVGESLLHLACRRGHIEIAEFLMNEAKVRWDLQDDFGRTILHDACWRPSASVELMEAILKVVSPEWLMASDIRGHTPFDYARREHMATWYDFLKEREDLIKRRLALLT